MGDDDSPRPLTAGIQASLERIEQRMQERPAEQSEVVIPDPSAGEAVLGDEASPVEDLTYTPSVFAQLCLPYRDPGDVARWTRTNGALTLTVRPGQWYDLKTGELREGYPYGVLPRLVVLWMATEAKRTDSRELVLGPSLTAFMGKLIIGRDPTRRSRPGGGPTGSFARLGDQLRRMLTATVTILDRRLGPVVEDRSAVFSFASESRLWWSESSPAGQPLWDSVVTLSEPFFAEIAKGSVPFRTEDLVALRAKSSSPLALDIYVWLAHRLPRIDKGSTPPIRWADLAVQFGGDYTRVRAFKAQFLKDLRHVLAVYPAARVEPGPKGLVLRRSPSPVPPARRRLFNSPAPPSASP